MANELSQAHDTFFKTVFRDPKITLDILTNTLPAEFRQIIDLYQLELQDSSFISKDMKKSYADLIYRTRFNECDGYICFLFEHKSTPDKRSGSV